MKWQHLKAFVWLFSRLAVNRLKRSGTAGVVVEAIFYFQLLRNRLRDFLSHQIGIRGVDGAWGKALDELPGKIGDEFSGKQHSMFGRRGSLSRMESANPFR